MRPLRSKEEIVIIFYQNRQGRVFILNDQDSPEELRKVSFEKFQEEILKENPFTGQEKLRKFLESIR